LFLFLIEFIVFCEVVTALFNVCLYFGIKRYANLKIPNNNDNNNNNNNNNNFPFYINEGIYILINVKKFDRSPVLRQIDD
jgi:hypothetical protein